MPKLHHPRVVIVTGAAQGIGHTIAETFLANGDTVVAADREFEGFNETSTQLFHAFVDVADESAVSQLFAEVIAKVGNPQVVVNAAGTSTMAFSWETTLAQWNINLAVNATGSFLIGRAAAAAMRDAGVRGNIVFISSQAGKNGYRGMSAYVASKHAVLGLTKTMAIELAGDGIRVNAVCPGIVETPMKWRERIEGAKLRGLSPEDIVAEDNSQVPLGRTAQPHDVADVVNFLASDQARYMTGQGINVTGGMTMH